MTDDRETTERLAVPAVAHWPIFPFEGDLRVRKIEPRFDEERMRNGDPGGEPCFRCHGDGRDNVPIWSNARWAVRSLRFDGEPAPFPAYMLETLACVDIGDLDEVVAAELGVLTLRLERAIMALGTVGRVHFNRWGDGARHFHVWFLGRPTGAWQFSGYTLPLWGFTLPSLPADEHERNDAAIAAHLTEASAAAAASG